MRPLLTSGLIVLCLAPSTVQAQSAALPRTGYDKSWYIGEFWSGERPGGFAVTRRNLTLMARSGMDKKLPRTVACRLPYLAVFHPWNKARNQKSRARYFTATKIFDLIAKENFEYGFSPFVSFSEGGGPDVKLAMKKNDAMQYLQYIGEGVMVVRIKGKDYVATGDLLDHLQDVPRKRFFGDKWVFLTCDNGVRAYIYFNEIDPAQEAKVPGVNRPGLAAVSDAPPARDITA